MAVSDSRGDGEVVREIEIHSDFAAHSKTIHIPAKGGCEAGFIEQRRMQQVRNRADFRGHFMDKIFAVGQCIRSLGQSLDVASYGGQVHAQGG